MCHVCLDEVTGAQRTVEREFSSENAGGNDAGELAGVVARGSGVSASDAEEVEHGRLRLEDGTATNGTDFY